MRCERYSQTRPCLHRKTMKRSVIKYKPVKNYYCVSDIKLASCWQLLLYVCTRRSSSSRIFSVKIFNKWFVERLHHVDNLMCAALGIEN